MTDKKYIAPPWIKYPTNPKKSDVWRTGSCAEYLIKFNENVDDKEEYLKIFPEAPSFTDEIKPSDTLSDVTCDFIEDPKRPIFIKLWQSDGKPKYTFDDKIDSNTIVMYDEILFDTSSHIHIGKDKFDSVEEIVALLESEFKSLGEEFWDEIKYTFYINALYYKIVSDINFTNELIKTRDNPIVFKSANLEWGIDQDNDKVFGKNLFGLAMMEIRDVVKDVYANYDLIDWDLSGEPYTKKRCMCNHHTH